ncbi:hypothetical protein LR48_Vigan08g128500 [Vigna angularis]|uniref:Uncharacterized protein n=1 Tax=Phaseolus angularis TaxID=3914 RepID=A0A0L9V655_PHAAN|nr:hypothetical protein LR48_Vigan08g128500 [Vigna angularis]
MEILVPFQQKHFGAYRGIEDFQRHPSKTIRMAQDPVAFMQKMQRRMEAMQAEIETLRVERDAAHRDHDAGRRVPPSQRSTAPTRTPIMEFPDSDQEGTNQGENSSQRSVARLVHAAWVKTLHPFITAVMEEQMPERALLVLERVFSLSVKGEALE